MMFVKIGGEKQILLENFKTYIENKYLNGKILNPTPPIFLNPL